jgi:hypothetical protein
LRFGLVVMLLAVGVADARTITLTGLDCDAMAITSAKAPRASWAGMLSATGVLNPESQVQFYNDMAILMRFPIDKAIPKDQRITKAELTLEPNYLAGSLTEIHVRRLVAEWGTGVCHQYRLTHPKKIEWAQPGGRGANTDRTNKDTAVFKIPKVGIYTVDVTEDVELWYTGAVANRGWILTMEQNTGPVYILSPYGPHHGGGKSWKLTITYEPK